MQRLGRNGYLHRVIPIFDKSGKVEETKDKSLSVFARERIKKGKFFWRHVPRIFVVYNEHFRPDFRQRLLY
jgi:hypothetical protein